MIQRDFLNTLQKQAQLECVMVWGPRQVGKTTLLDQLPLKSRAFLDDLTLRTRAENDPSLFLDAPEIKLADILFRGARLSHVT